MSEEKRYTEDHYRLAQERLNTMPHYIQIAIGGEQYRFDRNELKDHLRQRDEIGQKFVELQMETIKAFGDV